MGGFKGSPVLGFFDKRLPHPTGRTYGIARNAGFNDLNGMRFCHENPSSFLGGNSTTTGFLLILFSE
jgi:hypothetical protein